MNLEKYIGIPYCLHNKAGLNCWAFIANFYHHQKNETLQAFDIGTGTPQEISATFTAAFANGSAGFHQVEEPENFDVVVFSRNQFYHVGIWIEGKVLHCSQFTAGSSLQDLKTVKRGFKQVQFWRK